MSRRSKTHKGKKTKIIIKQMEYTGYDNSCKLVLQASEHVSNVGCTHRKGENPYRTKLMH